MRVGDQSDEAGGSAIGRRHVDRFGPFNVAEPPGRPHIGDLPTVLGPRRTARPLRHYARCPSECRHDEEVCVRLEQDPRAVGGPQRAPLGRARVRDERHGSAARLAHVNPGGGQRARGVRHQLPVGRDRRLNLEPGLEGELCDLAEGQDRRLRTGE